MSIYWEIKRAAKPWQIWSSGVADDVEDAQVEAMSSVLDENKQLMDFAAGGIDVQMYRMVDIEDFKITQENAETFRRNYLNLPPSDEQRN